MTKPKVIFLGNGTLASVVYEALAEKIELVFWAKKAEDLAEVERIKTESEEKIYGVLASYGVIIPKRTLELFEPEGILNVHPSRLPDLRGPSPIETAILRGDTEFAVSVMKLAAKMDAGPIYYQARKEMGKLVSKAEIYEELGRAGAKWLGENLEHLPEPKIQDESEATYCKMLDTSMAPLRPEKQTAEEMLDQVRAFQGFPKSRLTILGVDTIILKAHLSNEPKAIRGKSDLSIKGKDGKYLVIDELQPAGRKAMGAEAFLNGYLR